MAAQADDPVVPTAAAACTVDSDGRIVRATDALADLLGDDLTGSRLADRIAEADRRAVDAALRAAAAGGRAVLRASTAPGGEAGRMLDWSLSGDGRGTVSCVAHDVTDLVAETARLREENRRLALAEEMAEVGHWRLDLRDGTLDWSPQIYRIHGRDPALYRPTLETAMEVYGPEDRARIRAELDGVASERREGLLELSLIHPDGSARIVHTVSRPEIVDGEVAAIFGVLRDNTRLRRVEDDLARARSSLQSTSGLLARVMEGTRDCVLALDPDFRILAFNDAFASMMRRIYETPIALGVDHSAILAEHPRQHAGAVAAFRRALSGETFSTIREYPTLDGGSMVLDLSYGPIRDDAGGVIGLSVLMRDATERLRAEQALRESEARFRAVVESSLQGVLIHADFRPVFANETFARIFGFESVEALLAVPSVLDFLAEDRRGRTRTVHEEILRGGRESFATRYRERRRDGTTLWGDVILRRIDWDGAPAVQVTLIDVTDQVRYETQLETERALFQRQATIDELTGLWNRRHFLDRLRDELRKTRQRGHTLSLFMFDLDHFKNINDSLGHAAGDEALRAIPGICEQVLRKSDIVGRLGGEEFAVCLPRTSRDEAIAVAERLREALAAAEIVADGESFGMTASFGVAVADRIASNVDLLLKRADSSLYAAKAAGRNRVIAEEEG